MAIEASIQRAMPVHLFTHIFYYSHQDVEPHEIRTHPEHPSSPSLCFSTIHIIQSFVFCMVFCKSLSSCPYFFWSLYCMSFFDLRILNTPLQGRIQDFKLEGGALKKITPSGRMRENYWGISCEKSLFYAKKSNFFQLRKEARKFVGYFV